MGLVKCIKSIDSFEEGKIYEYKQKEIIFRGGEVINFNMIDDQRFIVKASNKNLLYTFSMCYNHFVDYFLYLEEDRKIKLDELI